MLILCPLDSLFFSGCNFMQRMLLRSRPLYNSVSTKGAKYSDTATRFLDLSNTCRRSWYQRKILWVTREYKRISKVHQYSRICILVPPFYLLSMTRLLYKEKFIISMPFLLRSLFNWYVCIILMIYIFPIQLHILFKIHKVWQLQTWISLQSHVCF